MQVVIVTFATCKDHTASVLEHRTPASERRHYWGKGLSDATRRDATRCDATRRDATRRDATRRDATRRDATRRDATRRDATRRDATATGRDGTGRDGTGRDGTGRDGTGRDGTGRDGTGRDGTGRDGTGRDGTGRDGTGRDGTGRDGMCESANLQDETPGIKIKWQAFLAEMTSSQTYHSNSVRNLLLAEECTLNAASESTCKEAWTCLFHLH